MHTIEVKINRTEALSRFEKATWKSGRMLEQPQSVKQVYNLQADSGEAADNTFMFAAFDRWVWAGIDIIREYLNGDPHYGLKQDLEDNVFIIPLRLPENWVIHSAPGLKYAMIELIRNGMLADWYDDLKPDQATAYKKKAELNKAEIHSIIYALNAP